MREIPARLARDLHLAVRTLRASRSLVLIATLSLGLGIGVNTTLYSVLRTVMLRPPTAADPARLVRIEPGNSNQISHPNFADVRAAGAFEGIAAYATTRLNLRSGDDVQQLLAMMVTPNLFSVLGAGPTLGRGFVSGDEPAAVVTHELWQRRLGGRPDVLGATLSLNGTAYVVVGVLPPEYRAITGVMAPELYVPVSRALVPGLDERGAAFLTMVGRLRPGVAARQGEAVVASQARALERAYPQDNVDLGREAHLFPVAGLESWRTRDTPPSMVVGLAAIPFVIFGLVLLIACANVAGLLYARGTARRREIAIRNALGASRPAVVRTLLAESVLLATFGSVAGLALTYWLCALASRYTLPMAPRPIEVRPDAGVLLYALALALVTGVACGLAPALSATRAAVAESLRRETVAERRRFAIRNALVGGQVALSMVLLFVSVLFLRSLAFIGNVDPGFEVERVLTAHVALERNRYTDAQRLDVAERMRAAAAALPGVRSAAVTTHIPLGGDVHRTSFEVQGGSAPRAGTYAMSVGPAFFPTLGIPVRLGREFATGDRAGAPAVAVVNESFVRAYALAGRALGARVRVGDREPWLEIVGVVADAKYASFGETQRPILYRPYAQTGGNLFVVARTEGAPAGSAGAMRRALADVDPRALLEVRTMRDATSLEYTMRRLGAWLLGVIGGLGLGLAVIGLYGVISHAVTRRTREIGIRLALGASRAAVLRAVLRDGLVLVGTGVAAGTLVSLGAARVLSFLMAGVRTADPLSIAATAALLLAAGLGASWVPGRRATRVDPLVALRQD